MTTMKTKETTAKRTRAIPGPPAQVDQESGAGFGFVTARECPLLLLLLLLLLVAM